MTSFGEARSRRSHFHRVPVDRGVDRGLDRRVISGNAERVAPDGCAVPHVAAVPHRAPVRRWPIVDVTIDRDRAVETGHPHAIAVGSVREGVAASLP